MKLVVGPPSTRKLSETFIFLSASREGILPGSFAYPIVFDLTSERTVALIDLPKYFRSSEQVE